MSTYVLVHGAWHGGWCWERLTPLLQERGGAQVLAPTLTGLGDRSAELDRATGLRTHVANVVDVLAGLDEPAILVGHSYGALVAREAADRLPDRVRHFVALEGWIGASGASMLSLAPDWFAAGVRAAADATGDGWRIPVPDPAVVGVVDGDDADWLRARLTPHPLRSFVERTELTGAVDSLPGTAILAAPGPLPFATWAQTFGYDCVQIDGGHDLMVTSPTALAQALLALEKR